MVAIKDTCLACLPLHFCSLRSFPSVPVPWCLDKASLIWIDPSLRLVGGCKNEPHQRASKASTFQVGIVTGASAEIVVLRYGPRRAPFADMRLLAYNDALTRCG